MNIRLANAEDILQIVDTSRRFYGASPWAALADFDDYSCAQSIGFAIKHGFVLLAEDDAQVVGVFGAYVAPFTMNLAVKVGTEAAFYVDPDARRGGPALRLIRAAKQEATERGCRWLILSTLSNSSPHVAELYVKLGARHIESSYFLEL
jgi:GNAT superfamily N-acetyltransferase